MSGLFIETNYEPWEYVVSEKKYRLRGRLFLAIVVMAIVYPLSFGPFMWLWSKHNLPHPRQLLTKKSALTSLVLDIGGTVYAPMVWLLENSPEKVTSCIESYVDLFVR